MVKLDLCFFSRLSLDLDDPSSFPNESMNTNISHCPPCVIQSLTSAVLKSGEPNTKAVDNFTEQHFSQEWTEYDDLPSSEDLSAFLIDLERDALGEEDGQTVPSVQSMTTEIATLKDVVCELSRATNAEDFTEFTDFPSSEDLDAFLADLELDCDDIPMSESPRTSAVSAAYLNSKPHCELEGSKCLVIKGHVVKDIGKTNNTKISSESLENKMQISSDMGFCVQEDTRLPCRANCSSYWDKLVHDIDCSDSQLLRDCESVFADMTENMRTESRAVEKPSQLLKRTNLRCQRRSISQHANGHEYVNNISTRRCKDAHHEKDIVCNTPLRNEQSERMRSRSDGYNANETDNGQQGDRSTSMDLHGNSAVSMLNESCDMMASAPFSPDLFSQSLSVVEGRSQTADLFSSPRLVEDKTRSRCTHGSSTPNLFSPSTSFAVHARSCSKEELNSVPLFSTSECSFFPSESPVLRVVYENEAASLSNVSQCDGEKEFNRSSILVNLHSTPYGVGIPSSMLSKLWTPNQVSPLFASAGSDRCNDISLQGTPVLFSQLSNSSL